MSKHLASGIFSGNIFGSSHAGLGQATTPTTSTTTTTPDAAPDSLISQLTQGGSGGKSITGGDKSVSQSFDTSSSLPMPVSSATNYTPWIIGGVVVVGVLGAVMLMGGRRGGTVAANRRRVRRNRRRSRR